MAKLLLLLSVLALFAATEAVAKLGARKAALRQRVGAAFDMEMHWYFDDAPAAPPAPAVPNAPAAPAAPVPAAPITWNTWKCTKTSSGANFKKKGGSESLDIWLRSDRSWDRLGTPTYQIGIVTEGSGLFAKTYAVFTLSNVYCASCSVRLNGVMPPTGFNGVMRTPLKIRVKKDDSTSSAYSQVLDILGVTPAPTFAKGVTSVGPVTIEDPSKKQKKKI